MFTNENCPEITFTRIDGNRETCVTFTQVITGKCEEKKEILINKDGKFMYI